MTDQERQTTEAIVEQLGEILGHADQGATSAEPHPARGPLDEGLREVKEAVLRMGMLVEDQIRAAIAALVAHDAEAAFQVIIGDARINEAQRHASTLVAQTIALHQPVARDLRFLLSLDHVTY